MQSRRTNKNNRTSLLPGSNLKYGLWKTLNRSEVGVEGTKKNSARRKAGKAAECESGDVRALLQRGMTKYGWSDPSRESNDGVIRLIGYGFKKDL